jgi:hypothetical protein
VSDPFNFPDNRPKPSRAGEEESGLGGQCGRAEVMDGMDVMDCMDKWKMDGRGKIVPGTFNSPQGRAAHLRRVDDSDGSDKSDWSDILEETVVVKLPVACEGAGGYTWAK